jgi:hypothetical protein
MVAPHAPDIISVSSPILEAGVSCGVPFAQYAAEVVLNHPTSDATVADMVAE